MRPNLLPEILGALLKLRSEGPTSLDSGICWHVKSPQRARYWTSYEERELSDAICEDIMDWLCGQFEKWPEYSGDFEYPVQHPDYSAHHGYYSGPDLWDKSTAYGQARWRLVDFLIKQAEAELG